MDSGNDESFDALVREHQAGLRAYIRALGAQDAWVDDLAQEVFLVAYRRRATFRPGTCDYGRWLRGIARNLVCNERRKVARRSRLLHEAIVNVLAETRATDASENAPVAQLVRAMNDCVARLPELRRRLLEGRYVGNADAPALASVFQLSAAAVRQSLARARLAVRRCIEGKIGDTWP